MANYLKIYCNSCQRETNHEILQLYEQINGNFEVFHWEIVRCAGCEETAVVVIHLDVDGQSVLGDPIVYPTRMLRSIKQFDNLDARLEHIYRETIYAFNDGSYILCAGGLRALVEGICAEQHITDGPKRDANSGEFVLKGDGGIRRGITLDCKIEGLAERNNLTAQQAQALHEHRFLGNKALHELETPSSETLILAITIVEHIMEGLYNIPARVDDLRRLRLINPPEA